MVNLTIKDLFYDKGHLSLIIAGLTISMLLVHFGIGMFNGTLDEASLAIDESPEYDAWVS